MKDCIAAVESAFADMPSGRTIPAGVLGSHVADGGFHVKTAGLIGRAAYFAAKINANFPLNPSRSGRPRFKESSSSTTQRTATRSPLWTRRRSRACERRRQRQWRRSISRVRTPRR
jgi:hypothetical protein